eukprot:9503840-Pyramimonas_sp.AAC.1
MCSVKWLAFTDSPWPAMRLTQSLAQPTCLFRGAPANTLDGVMVSCQCSGGLRRPPSPSTPVAAVSAIDGATFVPGFAFFELGANARVGLAFSDVRFSLVLELSAAAEVLGALGVSGASECWGPADAEACPASVAGGTCCCAAPAAASCSASASASDDAPPASEP